jgi:ParB family chromosome partitioning protein
LGVNTVPRLRIMPTQRKAFEAKLSERRNVVASIDQRNAIGKSVSRLGGRAQAKGKRTVTAESLVRAYRKEVDRQKLLVKKANVTQHRLLFVINGLRRLLSDEHFATLLRAEGMLTVPKPIAERLGSAAE